MQELTFEYIENRMVMDDQIDKWMNEYSPESDPNDALYKKDNTKFQILFVYLTLCGMAIGCFFLPINLPSQLLLSLLVMSALVLFMALVNATAIDPTIPTNQEEEAIDQEARKEYFNKNDSQSDANIIDSSNFIEWTKDIFKNQPKENKPPYLFIWDSKQGWMKLTPEEAGEYLVELKKNHQEN